MKDSTIIHSLGMALTISKSQFGSVLGARVVLSLLLTYSFLGMKAQTKQDSLTLITRRWKVVAGGNSKQSVKIPPPMQFEMDFRANGKVEFPTISSADKTLKWKFQGQSRLMMDNGAFTILVLKSTSFVIVENKSDKKLIMVPAKQ